MTPAPKVRLVVGFAPCRSDLCCHNTALVGSVRGRAEGLFLGGLGFGEGLEATVVLPDRPGLSPRRSTCGPWAS